MDQRERDSVNTCRREYLNGITDFIAIRRTELAISRGKYITPVFVAQNREFYRSELIAKYGWPLTEYAPCKSVSVTRLQRLSDCGSSSCTRIQIEALPGIRVYGLLFEPHAPGRHPLVIMQHGGGGTPELCCDYDGSNNYNRLGQRLIARNAVVFAPQQLLWNAGEAIPTSPHCEPTYNRMLIDAKLKQLGGGIIALELACLRRCLDALERLDSVNGDSMGIAGLSYGGMYSLLLAAVEPRIKSAYSVCYFSGDYQFADMYTRSLAGCFANGEIAGLVCPRALCIEVSEHDSVLPPGEAAYADYLRAREFYSAQGSRERIKFIMSAQDHKPSTSDEGIDFLFDNLN